VFYHGVSQASVSDAADPKAVCYRIGALLLDHHDPRHVLERSVEPVLSPARRNEMEGRVDNVVFPTAVDVRGRRLDIYYGAADSSVAVATTQLDIPIFQAPSALPAPGELATAS
jgi:predicted GH43/DUF377 family glycosyl hydrolase